MGSEDKKFYEFGKFCFDAQKLRLVCDGETVSLPPKSLETLKILLERKGETVTRETFFEKIWAESFVEDANLTVAVSTLRKTLAGFDENETFIQTVSGYGYRFVGEAVEKIEMSEQPIVVTRHALEHLTIEQKTRQPLSRVFIAVALVGLIATTAIVGVWLGRSDKSFAASGGDMPGANEAYEKGNALLQKRETCESISYFREAVAKDANFARGYSSLAAALAMCGDKGLEAEEAVAKSLALEPNSAEATATDGFIRMFRHWDWDGAETALRRAVALDANSVRAHHWLAVCLSIRGYDREAVGEMQRAIEIEPNSALLHADLGQIYYLAGADSEAIGKFRKSLEIDPDLILTHKYLRDLNLAMGNEKSAAEQQLIFLTLAGVMPEDIEKIRKIIERESYKGWMRSYLEIRFVQFNKAEREDRAAFSFAFVDDYVTLGDQENTLLWLENTVNCQDCVRPFWLPYVAVDPRYSFLRDDARFQAVLQKMNLAN